MGRKTEFLYLNEQDMIRAGVLDSARCIDVAEEIFRLTGKTVKVNRLTTEQYPAKAPRPKNSRLDKSCLTAAGFAPLPDWHDALERCLKEIEAI